MIGKRGSARRTAIDRWIISLNPFFVVIAARTKILSENAIAVGPTFIEGSRVQKTEDRIRRGAVVAGVGSFHVDFTKSGVIYKAWVSERNATLEVAGKATEATVERDLRGILNLVGLRGQLSAGSHFPSVTSGPDKR